MKNLLSFFAIIIAVFQFTFTYSQKADTIQKAVAWTNTYMNGNTYGLTREGHIYSLGFINHYAPNGSPLPIELVKMDLTTGTATYKTLENTTSAPYALWAGVFDSLGNVYLDINRTVWVYNLKDSIIATPLGNVFLNGQSLAYSMSLGRDNHIYFGGSSGGTFWSEYDPATKKLTKHEAIDPNNDYVLSIMGDSSWVYAQVGQRNSIDMWAIRKADDYKVKLFSIPNTTRYKTDVRRDGINVRFSTDTLSGSFLLKDGAAVSGAASQPLVAYSEINNSPKQYRVTDYYDAATSDYNYSIDGDSYKSIHIRSANIRNNIRFLFFDKSDSTGFGYVGDYYGNWYWYDYTTDSSYLLGNTGLNVYSGVQYNDSIFYFGNYPSGALMKWNKNREWTLQKFINGRKVEARDAVANPSVCGYFKSETAAGFHHARAMQQDTINGNIVCAGDVIRIGNTCSIGTYNTKKNRIYGYDFQNISGLSLDGLIKYKHEFIMSTNSSYGGRAKLYFYNAQMNSMTDSIDLGLDSYGKLYLTGDTLIGIASSRIYKIKLSTKQLMEQHFLTGNIFYSVMLSDGRIAVNTNSSLPDGFAKFVQIPYTDCYIAGNYLYAIVNGNAVIRIKESELKEKNQVPANQPSHQNVSKPKMKVFPNPVSSVLNVSLPYVNSQSSRYQVVDRSGKVIMQGIIPANSRSIGINVQTLPGGFYWLAVAGAESAAFLKQ